MPTNPTRTESPASSPASIEDLVAGAREGDSDAWTELMSRFDALLRATARRYRLSDADTEDITQNVWLLLVEHLDRLREPKALPGWIAVTAARECGRLVGRARRTVAVDPTEPTGLDQLELACLGDVEEPDAGVLRTEAQQAVRAGLDELPARSQDLLLLLAQADSPSYAEISKRLDMPIGSIGPTRARCLHKLSRTTAVRDLLDVAA
ncbi:RNA polymerase sigma factor [Nocardioides sp. GXZ039]|uniref:RNA polymerase sigma factor n=1 Tax=Nocardioides sp. GXZ039 TaxID=3136018 RepID=UPI0030F3FE23